MIARSVKDKKSLTLVEIVVAMVILSASVTGLFATFVSGRRIAERAKRRLIAINYARQIAESLKSAVRQDTYDTGDLGCGVFPCNQVSPIASPSGLFNPLNIYRIENILVGSVNMRKVTIKVTWDEPPL
ncbi:MAG: type II secretion system protein [Candidatus Omnitrophota bacterium]|nr:type II secretion system protein [Candidatus Omnitrophota bacterium]